MVALMEPTKKEEVTINQPIFSFKNLQLCQKTQEGKTGMPTGTEQAAQQEALRKNPAAAENKTPLVD